MGIEEKEEDTEPFNEKMQRLTAELGDLFQKSHTLEQSIKEELGKIGFSL